MAAVRARSLALSLAGAALLAAAAAPHAASAQFATFESGLVRPLALSPDGTRLYAVNTPDDRLEIFDTTGGTLTHLGSVPVGLEPVAVAARTNGEVWVVNHLSDSVSVVDVASDPPRVARTLLVGDEPRDVVFAGALAPDGGRSRAFVTTARRGQNLQNLPVPVQPLLTTPGTPRALVFVFDATSLGNTLTGTPLSVVPLFGDTPRALAATPDGSTVYAAIFHSGNQTTSLSEGIVCDGGSGAAACPRDGINVPGGLPGGQVPGGLPAPNKNVENTTGPETGLIVKLDAASGEWRDALGRNWTNGVRFDLPDEDVFKINALASPPSTAAASYAHVGTVLFGMLVNPTNGKLYVTNTDAHNEVRFEGPGTLGTTVRGHLHEARITVIDPAAAPALQVQPRHLNKHIDYDAVPVPAGVAAASLATPTGMAIASDGTVYVAAFGSSAIGTFAAAELEADSFTPSAASQIAVSGGGPAGLALDEANQRLYVLTRFDDAVKVIDTATKTEIAQHPLHDPEPAEVVDGRPFLYDARLTSSNGEASCSSCHVFGDFDSLAWDLGNPDDIVRPNLNPKGVISMPNLEEFHPLKGPMTTQTLRGLANEGPMHWRGDRTGSASGGDGLDEQAAFEAFNVAFDGLLGRDAGPLSDAQMTAFARFALEIKLPPNPVHNLDNSDTPEQAAGRDFFMNQPGSDTVSTCEGCHRLDRSQGFFGSGGETTFENETQEFKVAHLRNAYQKVGMFGMPDVDFVDIPLANRQHHGDQVRGFGFLHDGSIDTVFDFLHATVFFATDTDRTNLEQFVLAFDTTYAPIVGQQVTLTAANAGAVGARIDLLIQRAGTVFTLVGQTGAHECDLVAKGSATGIARGYLYDPQLGRFVSDRAGEASLTDAELRAQAASAGQELTYTAAPPGSGRRMGVDRDLDGYLDRDELDAGSDPADPLSVPDAPLGTPSAAKQLSIKNALPDDEAKNAIALVAKGAALAAPAPGSEGDPRCNGAPSGTVKATLAFASASAGSGHTTDLPCQNWTLIGSEAKPKGYKYKDKELDDGTAKRLVWKDGKSLEAQLSGKGPTALDYDLSDGLAQGSVSASLTSGTARICFACTADAGKDGSDGKRFLGKQCPAPIACAP